MRKIDFYLKITDMNAAKFSFTNVVVTQEKNQNVRNL